MNSAQSFLLAVILPALVLLYGYTVVRVFSKAYFLSKLEYQLTFMKRSMEAK
jgi:hypothetical protein